MKNSISHVLVSIFVFLISYLIAYCTALPVVKSAVIIAFIMQWVLFLPAYFLQTEKFYDIVGSLTYLTVVLYTFFSCNISSGFNIGNLLISLLIGNDLDFAIIQFFISFIAILSVRKLRKRRQIITTMLTLVFCSLFVFFSVMLFKGIDFLDYNYSTVGYLVSFKFFMSNFSIWTCTII